MSWLGLIITLCTQIPESIFGDIGKPEDIVIKDGLSQEVPHTKGIFESI